MFENHQKGPIINFRHFFNYLNFRAKNGDFCAFYVFRVFHKSSKMRFFTDFQTLCVEQFFLPLVL